MSAASNKPVSSGFALPRASTAYGRRVARGVAVTVAATIPLYPLIWLILTSFKTREELTADPWGLPQHVSFHNFVSVLSDSSLIKYCGNSLIVTSFTVGCALALGVPAAYALAHLNLRGARGALMLFLLAEMIAAATIAIPLLISYQWLGLDGSRLRLVVAYTVTTMGFTIFVIRGAFMSVPDSLREAARLDGCSERQVFLRVMVPQVRSAIVLVAVFVATFSWNEYFLALVLVVDESARTLPLGLAALQGPYTSDWPKIAAAVVLSALPTIVLYGAFQRKIAAGIGRSGAFK